jgi:hypothetical protein
MPSYTFRCGTCDASKEALVSYDLSRSLTLVCVQCGEDMTVAPVLSAHISASSGFAADQPAAGSAAEGARACGHNYACRCGGVRLSRPNPFQGRLGGGVKRSN